MIIDHQTMRIINKPAITLYNATNNIRTYVLYIPHAITCMWHIHYSDNDHASQLTRHGVSMPIRNKTKQNKMKQKIF